MTITTKISLDIIMELNDELYLLSNNNFFKGNRAECIQSILQAAIANNLTIPLSDGSTKTVQELKEAGRKYYSFKEINCQKSIKNGFLYNFNAIKHEELKANLYSFIQNYIKYLSTFTGKNNTPMIGTAKNLAIYDTDGWITLYMDVSNIKNDDIIKVSDRLQLNQLRHYKEGGSQHWRHLQNFFGSTDNILELRSKDFERATIHYTNLITIRKATN